MTTSDLLKRDREALAECEKAVDTWRDKAESARNQADALEADAGRQVLEHPESIGRVQAQISELRQHAGIADLAVIAAEDQVQKARRAILNSAARHMSERAAALRTNADAEDNQISKHLQRLRDLTGDEYGPIATVRDAATGSIVRREVGMSLPDRLRAEAKQHDSFAAELGKAAGQPEIGETVLEQLLRKADPDGPEAQAAAERKAEAQRMVEEQREREQADRQARDEWIEQRTADLRTGSRWSETRSEDYARLEFRDAVREHGSMRAALDALAESPLDAPLMGLTSTR